MLNMKMIQMSINNIMITSSKEKDIQFPFNKYEMRVMTVLCILGTLIACKQFYSVCYDASLQISPSYLGMRDTHDFQWQAFRGNFIVMLVVAGVWKFIGIDKYPSLLGLVVVTIMFRADVVLYLGIIVLSYFISIRLYKHKRFELIKWIFVLFTISFIEYNNRFRNLSVWISDRVPIEWFKNSHHLVHWASILNMSLLKMLSFGVDIHRSYYNKQALNKHYDRCKSCLQKTPCLKARDMFPSEPPTFINYINYILFPGTLLAGPPISYNNYHSFKTAPMDSKSPILRFTLVFVSFELFQHIFFISKPSESMTLVQLSTTSIMALIYIWYKFNIIWKWAKVWSYIQGVEVIDNMSRCVANNYGFEGFWRMWHRGFNVWLIRYMYVPLGGNKSLLKSYLLVFLFVAFWHDPELKLLAWAGVIILFIIPEVLVKKIMREKYSYLFSKYWFKYLSAFAGAIYISVMCVANIIGFGLGFEGVSVVLRKIRQDWVSECIVIIFLTITVNVMFYVRYLEKDDIGF